ncbi:RDD family protein [Patescibacteria group bacterium]|nr:RDD family protein [Patescibacteria group bacterium]
MNQRYAGFGVRFVATLIDGILLLVISYPVYYLFSIPYTLLGWFILLNSHFISTTSPHLSDVIILFMYMGLALLPALGLVYSYFVLYQKKYGQTIGKKIMKIKVVTYDDRTPTKSDFFRREIIGKFLSAIILGIGYLQVIWNPKKQALHDKCAKTYVVYTGNRQKKLSKLQLFIIIVFSWICVISAYLLTWSK